MYQVYAINKDGTRCSYAGRETGCKTYKEAFAKFNEHFKQWQQCADLLDGTKVVIIDDNNRVYASAEIHFEGEGEQKC